MSISLWKAEQLGKENFALGAASRDAEVATLRDQVTMLRSAASELLVRTGINGKYAIALIEALAATEQTP